MKESFSPLNKLKEKINKNGNEKKPFLFVVDFELTGGYFIDMPLTDQTILFECPIGRNNSNMVFEKITDGDDLKIYPIAYQQYQYKYDRVMAGLRRGDSFLTNLTIKTPIKTSLSLEEIFHLSNSTYKVCIPDQFVCFSPERFVKIENGIISTNPMKGTINAEVADAEQTILSDPKEKAEHYTIVDLLRNDLGMVAEKVKVERFRYIDRIDTHRQSILQVSSEITGKLNDDYMSHLGDIIFRMLPAGSICGAPKQSTINIIQKAENEPRGFYTGIFGYFDGYRFDSCVLIRYIEEIDNQKYFRSGGGITVYSDPLKEYQEVLDKIYLPTR